MIFSLFKTVRFGKVRMMKKQLF